MGEKVGHELKQTLQCLCMDMPKIH